MAPFNLNSAEGKKPVHKKNGENKSLNKKKFQYEETQKAILRAATKLFARQGYHKTTISDVCQEVGLTSGAIFYHFSSKEQLLDAVITRLERGVRIYSDYLGQVEKGSLKVMKEMMEIMCDHFERQPEATICLASLATEFAGSNHRIEKRLKDAFEIFVKAFSRILKDHKYVKNPRIGAISLFAAAQGIAVQSLLREGEISARDLTGAFISMMREWST